jgi:hypothetical protein
MRALAYLLGARALDAARDAEPAVRWSKTEDPLGPIATTEATAAAWRRWRERGDAEIESPAAKRAPSLVPKRA